MSEWFEHRLRTRLFPMLQSIYPEAIQTADVLRCHDAFVVRYDAEGMAELEDHQDTTSFSFTIALNSVDEYAPSPPLLLFSPPLLTSSSLLPLSQV